MSKICENPGLNAALVLLHNGADLPVRLLHVLLQRARQVRQLKLRADWLSAATIWRVIGRPGRHVRQQLVEVVGAAGGE